MARKLIDLSNERFGALRVVRRVPDPRGTVWLCRCRCGNEARAWSHQLRSGSKKTCGYGCRYFDDYHEMGRPLKEG